jgi:hypothetical protein
MGLRMPSLLVDCSDITPFVVSVRQGNLGGHGLRAFPASSPRLGRTRTAPLAKGEGLTRRLAIPGSACGPPTTNPPEPAHPLSQGHRVIPRWGDERLSSDRRHGRRFTGSCLPWTTRRIPPPHPSPPQPPEPPTRTEAPSPPVPVRPRFAGTRPGTVRPLCIGKALSCST